MEYLTALKIKGLSKAMSFNGADITIVRDKVREYATIHSKSNPSLKRK